MRRPWEVAPGTSPKARNRLSGKLTVIHEGSKKAHEAGMGMTNGKAEGRGVSKKIDATHKGKSIHSFKRFWFEHFIKSGTVLGAGEIRPRRVQRPMQ